MARVRSRFRPPAPAAPAVGVGEGPDSGLRRSGLTCEEGEGRREKAPKAPRLSFGPCLGGTRVASAETRASRNWINEVGPSFADVGRQLRLERGVAVVGEGEE